MRNGGWLSADIIIQMHNADSVHPSWLRSKPSQGFCIIHECGSPAE
jgi:hypothetical protein